MAFCDPQFYSFEIEESWAQPVDARNDLVLPFRDTNVNEAEAGAEHFRYNMSIPR